ncbi:hypothetical protein [Streptomyces specialis]|uniref:hypothetical protein n=1 Tax=Streptomyces specialis TaxID=498367 RepID=UPI00131DB136|nr:hypothetical protein [Streptomyces specialis]
MGFENVVDGTWKRFRIDHDPSKGPHLHVEIDRGPDARRHAQRAEQAEPVSAAGHYGTFPQAPDGLLGSLTEEERAEAVVLTWPESEEFYGLSLRSPPPAGEFSTGTVAPALSRSSSRTEPRAGGGPRDSFGVTSAVTRSR